MKTLDVPADVHTLNALAETWRTAPDGTRRFVPNFDPSPAAPPAGFCFSCNSPGPQTRSPPEKTRSAVRTTPAQPRARFEQPASPPARSKRLPPVEPHPWCDTQPGPRIGDRAGPPCAGTNYSHSSPRLRQWYLRRRRPQRIMRHLTLDDNARLVHVIAAPHPSPANGHHRSEQAERSVRALRLATRPRTP